MHTIEDIKEEYIRFFIGITQELPMSKSDINSEIFDTFNELVDDLTIIITKQLKEQGEVDCSKKLAR